MAGSSTQSVDSSKELAFHSSTTNLRENLMNRHNSFHNDDGVKKERQGALQSLARPKHCSEARAKELKKKTEKSVPVGGALLPNVCSLTPPKKLN